MNVCITTDKGTKTLGELIKASREAMGWTIRDVCFDLQTRTGFKLSPTAISDLENGYREPRWSTLAKLVAVGYIKKESGEPFAVAELFEIACEMRDPATGDKLRDEADCQTC